MRLTLFYAARFYRRGSHVLVQPAYGTYVEALARRVDELVLCGPVAEREVPGSGYPLREPNIRVVALPYYQRDVEAVRTLPRALAGIDEALRGADLASVMLPLGIMGPLTYARARRQGVPVFLHVVGDLRTQWSPRDYPMPVRPLLRGALEALERVQQRMIDETVTFAQGEALRRKHEGGRFPVVEAMETTLTDADLRTGGRRRPQGPPRLLYAGNLIRPKGVHVLLEALAALDARGVHATLDILGTGPFQGALEALTHRLGLGDTVRFRGFQDLEGVKAFMDDATLFVFPSFGEGMPRVILEAMARGLPVVSTAVGGIPGVIRHGRNGWLVSPGSAVELADAIECVLADRTLWERLSRAGVETAAEHTMERHADRIVDTLRAYALWAGD